MTRVNNQPVITRNVTPYDVRRLVLEQSKRANVGHVGSALSIADLVAALYDRVLRHRDPDDPDRDRVVVSQGHAVLSVYAAMHLKGWLDAEELDTYCADDSLLGVHPERALPYIQLRQKFPTARAIAYLPPESAWRIAAFSLTDAFDPYLALIGKIAASYDRFLDFSFPSPLTESKAPADTYDGSHYSREANERVLAALFAGKSELAVDWVVEDAATITERYHQRTVQFIAKTASGKAESTR